MKLSKKENLKEFLQERVDICNSPIGTSADDVYLRGCIRALTYVGIEVELVTNDNGSEDVRIWEV